MRGTSAIRQPEVYNMPNFCYNVQMDGMDNAWIGAMTDITDDLQMLGFLTVISKR